jgi:hypothetical protein
VSAKVFITLTLKKKSQRLRDVRALEKNAAAARVTFGTQAAHGGCAPKDWGKVFEVGDNAHAAADRRKARHINVTSRRGER